MIVKQIELKKSNPSHVIYLIYIPQSNRAPHMAADHVFYKRSNFSRMAMEEYEVRDISRRGDIPDLYIYLSIKPNEVNQTNNQIDQSEYLPTFLTFSVENKSEKIVEYFLVRLFIDTKIEIDYKADFVFNNMVTYILEDKSSSFNFYNFNHNTNSKMPIWKGVRYKLLESDMSVRFPKGEEVYILGRIVPWYG